MMFFLLIAFVILALILGIPALMVGTTIATFTEGVRTTKGIYRRLFLLLVGMGTIAFMLYAFKGCVETPDHFQYFRPQ